MKLPEKIFSQHIAVLGKTGSGKSSVLRLQVERLLDDKQPVCVIDPKGDWWGLKSSATGTSAGYSVVIFGGEHGDVPLNAHSGAHVAELIATGNRPCIIDLGGWMVGERTRFFVDFASTLFRTTRGHQYIVIDEVHNFAPQQKIEKNPDAMKMLHWANRLASEGRGKGLTILSASQRPQKVHKDFLTCAETLIAMRVIHKLDRDAVKDWIDGAGDAEKGKEVLNTLASMQRGEAWVWSPEIGFGPKRVTFPMFATYDSFAPKANSGTTKLKGWASVDLSEVSAKLAKVVEEAKANDPAELKKEISRLKREQSGKSPVVDEQAIERAVFAAVTDRDRHWKAEVSKIEAQQSSLVKRLQSVGPLATKIAELAHLNGEARLQVKAPAAPAISKSQERRHIIQHTPRLEATGDESLGKAERSVLRAFYWLRDEDANKAKVGFYSGYSMKSSGLDKAISSLRTRGLVEGWRITPAGEEAADVSEDKPGGNRLREWLRPKIGAAANAVLDALAASYPQRLSKEQVAEASGYSDRSSGLDKALSFLRTIEAAEGGEREGGTKAADVFFQG